jgi:H+-transporting ATPase
MFATLIISSQAGVCLLRERGHFWQSRPSRFLVGSSAVGLGVAALLAGGGILMMPLSLWLLLLVAGIGLVWFAALDWLKVGLFRALRLR